MDVAIDSGSGNLLLNNFTIAFDCKPSDLPDLFLLGNETMVQVCGEAVPCLFASTQFERDNTTTQIDLRFERGHLVRMFIQFMDKRRIYVDAADYYNGSTERIDLHLRWLRERLGEAQKTYTKYSWGDAGVAEDKSGGVFVFITSKNWPRRSEADSAPAK
jgi:hypothetical protein